MKRAPARKRLYGARLHELKKMVHVHVSKELRKKLNAKARALLANKGDSVKIMRGSHKGKGGKIAKVSYNNIRIYIEGISRKNAKGTEKLVAFHPSHLVLTDLNMSEERKKEFGSVQEKEEKK